MEFSRAAFDQRRLWAILFGFLLWLQLGAGTLSRELSYPDVEYQRVLVYCLPLILLFVVGAIRNLVVALLFVPASFGWVLVVTPREQAFGALGSSWSFIFISITLIGYVLAAAAWLSTKPSLPFVDAEQTPAKSRGKSWVPYRRSTLPRVFILIAIFLLSAGLVPLFPPFVERATASFAFSGDPDAVEKGIILCNLILFFAWCGVAYWLFFLPAVGVENSVRHLETRLQAVISRSERGRKRLAARVATLLAVGAVAGLLLMGWL